MKGQSVTIKFKSDSDHPQINEQIPIMEYKSPFEGAKWLSDCISEIQWDMDNNLWIATFTPDENAEIGLYDFRVKFQDDNEKKSYWKYEWDLVEVVNNQIY